MVVVSVKRRKLQRLTPAQAAATAYHEAGHAVIAHHLGQKIGREGASILPDADSDGSGNLSVAFA
jgi:ATP-dependent Zn protease